jgi:acetyl esterase
LKAHVLDRAVRALLDELAANPGPPVYEMTPDEARSAFLHVQAATAHGFAHAPPAQIRDWNVASSVGPLRLRVIRPDGARDDSPGIMYFHGGGWVLGGATTHDRLVRELAVGADATVVFVDYALAPEHRFPVAIEQAYAATCHVAEHAREFGIDRDLLSVAGDSAGGNIATVVALLAAQRGRPSIAGQVLFYPVTSADFDTASFEECAEGPWLTRAAMQWFWDQYLPDHGARNDLRASPLRASLEDLSKAPAALVITAENDILRDDGEAYGRRLVEAGVEVVSTRYNAVIHDFVSLNALASAPPRARGGEASGRLPRSATGTNQSRLMSFIARPGFEGLLELKSCAVSNPALEVESRSCLERLPTKPKPTVWRP